MMPASGITANLFEDEKKLVEILVGSGNGNDGLWQKQLQIKSGISKVKLSRKLRSLEQKVREFQGKEGIVIAPKVTDGNLYGFAVTTKVVGGGYSGMNEEILELGKHCEASAR